MRYSLWSLDPEGFRGQGGSPGSEDTEMGGLGAVQFGVWDERAGLFRGRVCPHIAWSGFTG